MFLNIHFLIRNILWNSANITFYYIAMGVVLKLNWKNTRTFIIMSVEAMLMDIMLVNAKSTCPVLNYLVWQKKNCLQNLMSANRAKSVSIVLANDLIESKSLTSLTKQSHINYLRNKIIAGTLRTFLCENSKEKFKR